jgi:hypothetical protein
MSEVVVVIGAGRSASNRPARQRRKAHPAGRHPPRERRHAAEVMRDARFDVSTATVDVSSRVRRRHRFHPRSGGLTARRPGEHPRGRPVRTALVLEEFGNVIGGGGAGVVIASQPGHRLGALTADQDTALATIPADELLKLPMLQPDRVTDPVHAYQLAKRGNLLRVVGEAVRWASGVPGSTRSVPASSSLRWPGTS